MQSGKETTRIRERNYTYPVVQVLGVSEPPGIGGHRIVRFHGGRRGVNS